MKTVSGKVLSTQPISVSRAAKLISAFTASDNEASPAFSAYLRRSSAAFTELVHLHKECNIPLGESRNKKDRSTGFITLGTPISSKVTDVGLSIDKATGNLKMGEGNVLHVHNVSKKSKKNKDQPSSEHDVINEIGNRHDSEVIKKIVPDVDGGAGKKSKKKRGSDVKCDGDQDAIDVSEGKNTMGNPNAIEELKNDLPDVGDVGKKSRKKRGTDDHVAVIDNDRSHDAIKANEVKDEMGSPNASGELKKKKKKIDKLGKENPVVASETVQEVQHRPHRPDDGIGEAVGTVQNIRDERKKHKKSKVKEVKETEHKDDGNVMKEGKVESKNDVSDGKKHKKKRSHEPEIRENGCSVETEAADKKANRKRKHERAADGELEGSHEAVRAKKKKYNH
ncbi:uncharacterized protein LOC141591421 [Silene latifolia]|uniref:uncharacterized protein LOC141591421 n=1 Tax=Silene latifolia TaxID=37657 RepID=UPI003D76E12D